jgi:hypothetical protein
VTTFENESPALYYNNCVDGQIEFRYAIRSAGIDKLNQANVSFGTGFLDIDNDGWEDIVFVNGHVRRHPTRSPLQQLGTLLKNQGNGRFLPITRLGGPYFNSPHRGRGLAIGDLDNDGRSDLVINHLNEPAVLLRNTSQENELPRNHWLGIELVGRNNRDIVGARVVVESAGRRLTRFAKGGGSYLSSGDRRIIVGLGDNASPGEVAVFWPRGEQQHWEGLGCDRYWRLVEGKVSAESR